MSWKYWKKNNKFQEPVILETPETTHSGNLGILEILETTHSGNLGILEISLCFGCLNLIILWVPGLSRCTLGA